MAEHQSSAQLPSSQRPHRHEEDHLSRSRSRSPRRSTSHEHHRTRSPYSRSHSNRHDSHRHHHDAHSHHRRHHHHHREHRRHSAENISAPEPAPVLPFNARQLRQKGDFDAFRPVLASYLDIQKGLFLEELGEREVKGRWKGFVRRWNRGELAEGWYDPFTFQRATAAAAEVEITPRDESAVRQPRDEARRPEARVMESEPEDGSNSDDSIGPELPGQENRSRGRRTGPSIPNLQDLELKREMDLENGTSRREDIRSARKVDRKLQKEALDELVPRAEAGTRERQLEKKAEVNATMKAFREKSPGATAEVPDAELMGGGDGIADFKRQKMEVEKKKNERELRREEILRARAAEREERLAEYRTKEEGTMTMLKALAQQRFG